MSRDNLAIWKAVEKTDPAYTKKFTRTGGFSGTAINQTYQVRRATEHFGPIGIGWGFNEVEHLIADGAPDEKIWFCKVRLWYMHGGERGEVEQWGATAFVGKNKYGLFTDEEAAKKSITDAVGKCLSLLGFSADVFLGCFDDHKYVNDRRREEAENKRAESAGEQVGDVPPYRPANGNGHHNGNGHASPPVAAQPPQNGVGEKTPEQRQVEHIAQQISLAATPQRVQECRATIDDPRRQLSVTAKDHLVGLCISRTNELNAFAARGQSAVRPPSF